MKTGFYDFLCPALSPFYDRSIRPADFKKESLNKVNENAIRCYWKWAALIPAGSAAIYLGSESPFKYICAYCAAACAWIAFSDGKEVLNAVSQCEEEYLHSLQIASLAQSNMDTDLV